MTDDKEKGRRSHRAQMLGSLIAAVLLVIAVVAAVTGRLGPASLAELEAREDADHDDGGGRGRGRGRGRD